MSNEIVYTFPEAAEVIRIMEAVTPNRHDIETHLIQQFATRYVGGGK